MKKPNRYDYEIDPDQAPAPRGWGYLSKEPQAYRYFDKEQYDKDVRTWRAQLPEVKDPELTFLNELVITLEMGNGDVAITMAQNRIDQIVAIVEK